MSNEKSDLKREEIRGMDLDSKIKMLEAIADKILDLQIEFSTVAGRYAELRAQMEVYKQVKSALQSAIKAETQ